MNIENILSNASDALSSKQKENTDVKKAGYYDGTVKSNISKIIDIKRNDDKAIAKISENEFKKSVEACEQSELIAETLNNLLDFYKSFDSRINNNEKALMQVLQNLEDQKVLIVQSLDKING